jgi:hypothetical protein
MHHQKLMNKNWKHVEERFQKRLSDWKSKMLSVGGRLLVINSVLSSLPMSMMSFFEIPRGLLKNWIILDLGFSDKVMSIRRNID